jgi:hypothetical protein
MPESLLRRIRFACHPPVDRAYEHAKRQSALMMPDCQKCEFRERLCGKALFWQLAAVGGIRH